MFKQLKIRNLSYLLSAVILLVIVWLVAATQSLRYDVEEVEEQWQELQQARSVKAQLESVLRSEIGYGGLVHYYFNYLLRNDPELKEQAIAHIWGARTALRQYFDLNNTLVEQVALQDIGIVLMQYERAFDRAQRALVGGESIATIIASQDIDEALVERSLQILRDEVYDDSSSVGKVRLKSDIRAALGFGQFIYHFKKYVITADVFHAEQARNDLAEAAALLAEYRNRGLTTAERLALDDIEQVLKNYANSLELALELVAQGKSPRQVDGAIQVDDEPALRSFIILSQEINRDVGSWEANVTQSIVQIKVWMSMASWWISVGLLGVALLMLWVINALIVAPVYQISRAMLDLSHNKTDIELPDISGTNELGVMMVSVKAFRDNILFRDTAEQKLQESSDEVARQLDNIQHLKDESEQKTLKALSLAESLASVNAEANEAKSLAQFEERRFRSILGAVHEAVISISASGTIDNCNPSAELLFNYREHDITGRAITDFFHGDDEPLMRKHIYDVVSGQGAKKEIEYTIQNRQGELIPVSLSMDTFRLNNEVKVTLVMRDISEERKWKREIERLALHDSLTGLANRNKFQQAIEQAAKMSKRLNKSFALLMIDLDRFKPVNDQYGHKVGDDLLVYVGQVLLDVCRETDTAARLGGDEFAVILAPTADDLDAEVPAQRIVDALQQAVVIDGYEVQIGASVGISYYPGDSDNLTLLQQYADQALYSAKYSGRNNVTLFRPAMQDQTGIS